MKPKRFFFHYNKAESKRQGRNVLTVHWEKTCHLVNHIVVEAKVESYAQKRQPHCILRGFARKVEFTYQDLEVTAKIFG